MSKISEGSAHFVAASWADADFSYVSSSKHLCCPKGCKRHDRLSSIFFAGKCM